MLTHELKEAQEKEIHLQDDDPELIESMLVYLYTAQYPSVEDFTWIQSNQEEMHLYHPRLYAVADNYDVPALKTAIKASFAQDMIFVRENDGHEFSNMAKVIAAVYESTPDSDRGLRDTVQLLLAECQEKILGLKSIQPYLQKNQHFALDVLKNHCKDLAKQEVYKYWCRDCVQYVTRSYSDRCPRNHPLDDLATWSPYVDWSTS